MRILKVISFALLMTISVVHQVQAVGIIAGRTIVGIGCADDGVCFINLSGSPFGIPGECISSQVRWDGTSSEGRGFTATALTARAAGFPIRIGFNDTPGNCFDSNRSALTFITVL